MYPACIPVYSVCILQMVSVNRDTLGYTQDTLWNTCDFSEGKLIFWGENMFVS